MCTDIVTINILHKQKRSAAQLHLLNVCFGADWSKDWTPCLCVWVYDNEQARSWGQAGGGWELPSDPLLQPHLPQPSIHPPTPPTSQPPQPISHPPSPTPASSSLKTSWFSALPLSLCVCVNFRDEWLSVFHSDMNAVWCCSQTGGLIHTLAFSTFPTHFCVTLQNNPGLCSEAHHPAYSTYSQFQFCT